MADRANSNGARLRLAEGCELRVPFRIAPSAEADAKQGAGSGREAWVIADARGSFALGLFTEYRAAQAALLAVEAIWESGRRAAEREGRRQKAEGRNQKTEGEPRLRLTSAAEDELVAAGRDQVETPASLPGGEVSRG